MDTVHIAETYSEKTKETAVDIMAGPRKYIVELSEEEVATLEKVISDQNTSEVVAKRCRILLDLDDIHGGVLSHTQIAEKYDVSSATVSVISRDYVRGGIHAITQTDADGNPIKAARRIDERVEEALLKMARGPVPEGHCRWTLRLLAERASIELQMPISRETIRKILKKANFDLADTFIASALIKKIVDSDKRDNGKGTVK